MIGFAANSQTNLHIDILLYLLRSLFRLFVPDLMEELFTLQPIEFLEGQVDVALVRGQRSDDVYSVEVALDAELVEL